MTKKLLTKLIVAIASVCLLSSCAAVQNYSTVPYVGLENGNFKYVRTVEYSVENMYWFGVGGLLKDDLYKGLKDKANLQNGEVLVNVNTHKKISFYFGILVYVETVATADVVRLNP